MSRMVLEHPNVLRWKHRVEASGNIIQNIKVLAAISRDQVNLFGTILDCQLLTPEGVEISRCVMLCGDSVVIIPVLTCCDDGEVYTLMVEQRRIVDGDYAKEFPSGGIDMQEYDPKLMACQELREELHLTISSDELVPLNADPIKVNPSISGDVAYFYYFEKEVSLSFLKEMDGHSTGCHKDNEFIRVRVLKMSEISNVLTLSALIGLKLLERKLKRVF